MTPEIVDRIIYQLAKNNVETINLGGNEPIFTDGPDASKSLLPYIIERLDSYGLSAGITTGGSTEIPYISRVMQSYFPNAKLSSENKMASVGLGLAYDAMRRFCQNDKTR